MQVDAVIPLIYQSAVEPEGWYSAVEEMSKLFSDCAVAFCDEDAREFGVGENVAVNFDAEQLKQRARNDLPREFWLPQNNRFIQACVRAAEHEIVERKHVISDAQFGAAKEAAHFFKPLELYHFAAVRSYVGNGRVAGVWFGRNRRQHPFSRGERATMQALSAHIKNAVHTKMELRAARQSQQELHALFDAVGQGVVVLNEHGRICECNGLAQRIIRQGAPLGERNGHLRAIDPAGAVLFDTAIRTVARGQNTTKLLQVGAQPAALFLRIVPLPAVGQFGSGGSKVAVFIKGFGADDAQTAQAFLSETYGLTKAESMAAVQYGAGQSVSQMAATNNVSPNTLKSQLKSVFEKTHVRSQVQLIQLLGRFQ